MTTIYTAIKDWAWFLTVLAWWLAVALFMAWRSEADAATGSAPSRSVEAPDRTIVGVLFDLGVGGIQEAMDNAGGTDLLPDLGRIQALVGSVQIAIDGRSVFGFPGWFQALARIAAYSIDWTRAGRVEFWRADRHYTIQDGLVSVAIYRTVVERGPLGRPIPVCVHVRISALETDRGVTFIGTARGSKAGCLGGHAIEEGLTKALKEIEATGRSAYASGRGADVGSVAERIVSRFKLWR